MSADLVNLSSIITFSLVLLTLGSLAHVARAFAYSGGAHRFDAAAQIAASNMQIDHLAKMHPNPIWLTDQKGRVIWKNDACRSNVEPLFQVATAWIASGQDHGRTSATTDESTRYWYDLVSTPCGENLVWFATPADAEIRAEETRREFVQTLAKTFAQLSTGLAIFDKNRNLALFNPALLELTGLPFESLSQRPSLSTFLDTLRSNGLLPEPRDYTDWRKKISQLEAQAEEGSYSDIWELPEGVIYRVTGKPHPGGAIAFLIEDISIEISRTRAVRQELGMFQSVFDASSQMAIVFNEKGQVLMSNAAFDALWGPLGFDDRTTTNVISCLPIWQHSTQPNPAWCDLRDYVTQPEHRAEWSTTVRRKSGQTMSLRCTPLPNRLTLVEFGDDAAEPDQIKQLRAHG